MRIIYADDEPGTLQAVGTFLTQYGHQVKIISTTNIIDFQEKVLELLNNDFLPEVIISGGHNVLRDSDGQELFNVAAFELSAWLHTCNLPEPCRFILFSRDEKLVERAGQHPNWGFGAAVIKGQPDSLERLRGMLVNPVSSKV